MYVSYDVSVNEVPEPILLVPFIANLAPVAWILDAELSAPSLDSAFANALEDIRQAFRQVHPDVQWLGKLSVDEAVDLSTAERSGGAAVLFSGGVDSLSACFIHAKERLRLISVWGADVGLHERQLWGDISEKQRSFARYHGWRISFVSSNFRTFFHSFRLLRKYFPGYANWYSAAQQGLGLTSLCAPLVYLHGLPQLYIAATFTRGSVQSWGSHPEIDNRIRWASTRVIHDGLDLGRQQKIAILARQALPSNSYFDIRVCWGRERNCGRCEKCVRTIVGLLLEGLHPRNHGFEFDLEDLAKIRYRLETGSLGVRSSHTPYWLEIRERVRQDPSMIAPGSEGFFGWLKEAPPALFSGASHLPWPRRVRQFLVSRPEPFGKGLRRVMRYPFP
jgi:hypothetical protein